MICLDFALRRPFRRTPKLITSAIGCKMTIYDKSSSRRLMSAIAYQGSPVQTISIGSHHRVHVKRDDLLGEVGTGGNKARKLAHFRRLMSDPAVRQSYKGVISTGGGQSNAMLATAHFAKEHGLDFDYFSRPLSTNAHSEVQGNLSLALSLGMHLHECVDINKELETFRSSHEMSQILDLPRGVSCNEAEEGIAELAQEVHDHFVRNFGGSRSSCLVFLPSGTGTTAMFLNRHLQLLSRSSGYQVTTIGVSVAMKPNDILHQIQLQHPNEELGYPVFTHPSRKRIRFAVPDHSVKAIWCAMKRKGVELDLIYGPVAWMTLFEYLSNVNPDQTEVYYIHTGGLTGNDTQMHRYDNLACNTPSRQL